MQIGLECFMDEQISSMIASENRHGECEIQGKKECIVSPIPSARSVPIPTADFIRPSSPSPASVTPRCKG